VSEREGVDLSAVRTTIGKHGSALKDVSPTALAAAECPNDRRSVRHVGSGNIIHTQAKDIFLARVAAIRGGCPVETPSLTLNRLCGSGRLPTRSNSARQMLPWREASSL
jgi:acetyl-CoA C-acetyltransferase